MYSSELINLYLKRMSLMYSITCQVFMELAVSINNFNKRKSLSSKSKQSKLFLISITRDHLWEYFKSLETLPVYNHYT